MLKMPVFYEIKKYCRFCTGLRKFLKETISLNDSREIVKQRMAKREEVFLNVVEKAIYKNPKSPYLGLLKPAGYQFVDVKDLVKQIGIEQTLNKLVRDGVYITFDEFKGRKKVVRKGNIFHFKESDFDNPFLSSHFDVESGATSGTGTRTMIDYDFLTQEAVNRALVLDIYGLIDAPSILWFPVLPGNAGIQNIFRQAKINRPPIKWFSQVDERSIRPSIKDRLGTRFIVNTGRLLGCKIPNPEYVDLNDAHKVAVYLAHVLNKHSKCSFWTYVNSAIRICMAARDRNLNLKGTSFFVSGEPITSTKLNEIKSTGADAIPYFAFVEGGIVAYGCANSSSPDDMHILRDRVSVITHKKRLKNANDTVDALLFTSLLPESPKILLNVETGDSGSLTSKSCGCGFEAFGLSDHISSIRSFEKFTSEGMTFMASDLIHIVEDVLPAKFGGSSADYQVLEEPEENGITFLSIAVSPRVGTINESDVIKMVLRELGKGIDSKRLMAEMWSKADTIKIKRVDPIPTKRGKISPFRSVGN